jgi:tetratricopeptide (TPR) repeat protein
VDPIILICKPASRWLAGAAALAALLASGTAEAARRDEPDAIGRYARARMADAIGLPDEALAAYQDALTASPDSSAVALRAYREAVEAGNKPMALRAARALERLQSLPPDAPVLLFVDLVQRGDWRAAERELDRVEAAQSFAFLVPALRAWMLFGSRQGDPLAPLEERARDTLGFTLAREQRALLLLAQGKADDGAEALRTLAVPGIYGTQIALVGAARLAQLKRPDLAGRLLTGDDPEFVEARALLATGKPLPDAIATPQAGLSELLSRVSLILLSERAPQSALLMGRMASFADGGRTYPKLATAVILNTVERRDAALDVVAGLEARPLMRRWTEQTRYEILQRGGRTEEALALAKAMAERPEAAPQDWVRVGEAQASLGQHKDAADAFGKATALVTRLAGEKAVPWHYWLQQGRELESAGDWPGARAMLQKAVAAGPDQATALNHLGYSMLENGDDADQATGYLIRANALRPGDAAITDSLGWAWVKRGDLAKGIPLLESAVEAEPALAEISEHLGDAYWKAGRNVEARYAWRQALIQLDGAEAARLTNKMEFGLKAIKSPVAGQ